LFDGCIPIVTVAWWRLLFFDWWWWLGSRCL